MCSVVSVAHRNSRRCSIRLTSNHLFKDAGWIGAASRQKGIDFEEAVAGANALYKAKGLARIERLHPHIVITRDGKGYYKSVAHGDYEGVLHGGRSILIECKSRDRVWLTPTGKLSQVRLDVLCKRHPRGGTKKSKEPKVEHQIEALRAQRDRGGLAIVLVHDRSYPSSVAELGTAWAVPWSDDPLTLIDVRRYRCEWQHSGRAFIIDWLPVVLETINIKE